MCGEERKKKDYPTQLVHLFPTKINFDLSKLQDNLVKQQKT